MPGPCMSHAPLASHRNVLVACFNGTPLLPASMQAVTLTPLAARETSQLTLEPVQHDVQDWLQ